MIIPFLIFYVLPLLIEIPWLLTGSYLFFVTLHATSRIHLFSDNTYSFLPKETANRLRIYTSDQERHYMYWCLSGLLLASLIAVFRLLILPESEVVQALTSSGVVAVTLAIFYSPFYHNKAELLGNWSWPRLRASSLWVPFHGYFNFTPVYMHTPPPDLPTRDERRQTMKKRKKDAKRIHNEMATCDTRAFLASRFEPKRFFTLTRRLYERVVSGRQGSFGERSGPQNRRPRVYAAHPHGLSAITAVFGALMYGPDPMLPEAENVRVAVADILFYIPILREWALLCGCISAAPEAISHSLGRSRDVFVLPGGMLEQAMADFRKVEMVWNRHGFCRIAYHHQASIVPICSFGENETYMVFNWWPQLRLRNYRRFGYAFPWLFIGPFPANVTPVIGLPIDTFYVQHTDASRRRAQRYLDRHKAHPSQIIGTNESDGDTPLVDLMRVSRTLTDGIIDMKHPVSDYYGTGYGAEEDLGILLPHKKSAWSVERAEEHKEDDFVTLLDAELDEEDLIEASFVADLQRAFYAQFVDLRDCAVFALPNLLPDIARETWGDTLSELKKHLNRDSKLRIF